MGFASGLVSYQRFFIEGTFPTDLTDELLVAVQHKSFGRMPAGADETQIGWVGPRHLLENEIEARHIAFGRFVLLGVRIDRLSAPSAVVRSYVHIEEQTMLETSGREFLHRKERRLAREAARDRADKEARGGAFRRMSMVPLMIDLERRMVYLGALGTSMADKVMQLFRETFAVALEPAEVERVAGGMLTPTADDRKLENLAPMRLVPPPDGHSEGGGADFAADLSFLGKELLTWLWYQTDARDAGLRLHTGDEVTVMIDKTLRLRCDYGLTGTDVITADGPTLLPEAKAALRIGKQPTKAGLILGSPLGEFRLTLDGLRLTVSSLALPEEDEGAGRGARGAGSSGPRRARKEADQGGDAHARIEQRLELVADAAALLDALFELFLRRRISGEWTAEQRAMSAWAQGGVQRTMAAAGA